MHLSAKDDHLWGISLAGGSGRRLQCFIRLGRPQADRMGHPAQRLSEDGVEKHLGAHRSDGDGCTEHFGADRLFR